MSLAAAPPTAPLATLDDLMRVEGKAELIAGRIVKFMPNGHLPGRVATQIVFSLMRHSRRFGRGEVYGDGVGFAVRRQLASGRQSFCPDAAYHDGPLPRNPMRFIEGPPTFAVEVRSEHDYGPSAERASAAKRADYFEAGTRVVWDVDPMARTVTAFRESDPTRGDIFTAGQMADAEPAVPGWRMAVDDAFV